VSPKGRAALIVFGMMAFGFLVGCGQSQRERVAATAGQFLRRADCGQLTIRARVALTGEATLKGCARVFASRPPPRGVTVGDVSIRSRNATAKMVDSYRDQIGTISLLQDHNRWLIDGMRVTVPPVGQQPTDAVAATQLHPKDPHAWGALLQARWTSANQAGNYDATTGTRTAEGRQELCAATQAWQRYLQLDENPDPNLALLAARAYAALGDYADEANAWGLETLGRPSEAKGFECLAAAAYQAKETHRGDLAAARALSLVPKAQQLQTNQALQAAKLDPQIAQRC
jgi:hypothetical protein